MLTNCSQADKYGDSEDLLGKWFAANPGKRENIFLASKFGIRYKTDGSQPPYWVDSSPEYCLEAIDESLRRLGLPFVDLYYVHRLDGKTPVEKTMGAMVKLKKEGKVKHIGLSECSATSLRRAHAVHPITAIQVEYSLFALDIESPERKLLDTARELGVAIVAYSPLGNGLLTNTLHTREDVSKPGDLRQMLPWFSEQNIEQNGQVITEISEMAKAKGVSAAQLALAWLLSQGDDIFPIPGTTKAHRLVENLDSLSVTLSSDEEKELRKISSRVAGVRFNALTPYAFGDTPSV